MARPGRCREHALADLVRVMIIPKCALSGRVFTLWALVLGHSFAYLAGVPKGGQSKRLPSFIGSSPLTENNSLPLPNSYRARRLRNASLYITCSRILEASRECYTLRVARERTANRCSTCSPPFFYLFILKTCLLYGVY